MRAPTKLPIAVYNLSGNFYATSDYCTHEKSSLCEEGYIDGEEIECGWHFAKFCIKTGAVTAPPARDPLPIYEVSMEDGEVYVTLPDDALQTTKNDEEKSCESEY